ncbi:Lysoplasmalogenase [Intoshia linei]|uniref:lysoplasmalogenase n=1 Tax=Intoshia linei TaxID=1819745 RepID=A0A177B712_9BILA|nr:Lysoplasmalogenase [Intoshia linei]
MVKSNRKSRICRSIGRDPVAPKDVVISVGPKLILFIQTVMIFFLIYPNDDSILNSNKEYHVLIKIFPIVSLIVFVILNGMKLSNIYTYPRRIMVGLMFSMVGDILMVYKEEYLLYGIFSFAMAHIYYSLAFGIIPSNHPKSATLIACTIFFIVRIMHPYLINEDFIKFVFLHVYASIIGYMCWRSIVRVNFLNDLWSWTKLSGCIGAILFFMSDIILCYNIFAEPIYESHKVIMITYYAGQMCIALSVVDYRVDYLLNKQN